MDYNKLSYNNQIGKNIEKYRKQRGYTQAHLAKQLGLTPQQVQKYESGKDNIPSGRIPEILKAMNISAEMLFNLESENFSYEANSSGDSAGVLQDRAENENSLTLGVEEMDLLRAFAKLKKKATRKNLIEYAKSLQTLENEIT